MTKILDPEVKKDASSRIRASTVARSAMVLVLAVGLVVVGSAVISGGWQIQPVLSGSMRPGLPIGGVVVLQRVPTSSLQVRDVILFHPPGEPRTTYVHRIVSMQRRAAETVISTQGDANSFPDPWHSRIKGRTAYIARFSLPLLGYAAVWDHSTSGRTLLLTGAGILALALVASVLYDVRRKRRQVARQGIDAADVGGKATPAVPKAVPVGVRPESDYVDR